MIELNPPCHTIMLAICSWAVQRPRLVSSKNVLTFEDVSYPNVLTILQFSYVPADCSWSAVETGWNCLFQPCVWNQPLTVAMWLKIFQPHFNRFNRTSTVPGSFWRSDTQQVIIRQEITRDTHRKWQERSRPSRTALPPSKSTLKGVESIKDAKFFDQEPRAPYFATLLEVWSSDFQSD